MRMILPKHLIASHSRQGIMPVCVFIYSVRRDMEWKDDFMSY